MIMSKTIKTQKEMIGGATVISLKMVDAGCTRGLIMTPTAGSHIRDGRGVSAD
jgi:hypothetical protein